MEAKRAALKKVTDNYDRKSKELDKTVLQMKAQQKNLPSQPTTEQDFSEVKNLKEQLEKEIQLIKCWKEKKCSRKYFSDCPLGYWEKKYNDIWNTQGRD